MATSTSNNNNFQDTAGRGIRRNGANVRASNDIRQTMNAWLKAKELIDVKLEEIKQVAFKLCHESHNLSEEEKEATVDLLIDTYSSLVTTCDNLAVGERKCQSAKSIETFTALLDNNGRVPEEEPLDEIDHSTVEYNEME